MSEDIVDRLRDGANWTGPLKLEAADEIERLRKRVENLCELIKLYDDRYGNEPR